MRVESSVTSVSWIPSKAIPGLPKSTFETGVSRYDPRPWAQLSDSAALRATDAFRVADELRAGAESTVLVP